MLDRKGWTVVGTKVSPTTDVLSLPKCSCGQNWEAHRGLLEKCRGASGKERRLVYPHFQV